MSESLNRGYTYRERVRRVPPGTTVLSHLSRNFRHSTETRWRERLEAGELTLDGVPARAEMPLAEGMILAWSRPPWFEPGAPLAFGVLHRDDEVLAVAKPAGLPTLPGSGYLEHTLLSLVRRDFPQASAVHRLGRWTSGVVLFPLTPGARAVLAGAFRTGKAWKRYRALGSGRPIAGRWTVEDPIGPVPHRILGTVHALSPLGRPSSTEIFVLEQREDGFLADVVIATGRPHQIRIHFAASGHPLVGDPLYPEGGVPDPDSTALPGDPGYLLHAAEIRLPHPNGSGELRVEAPPPAPLRLSGEAEAAAEGAGP